MKKKIRTVADLYSIEEIPIYLFIKGNILQEAAHDIVNVGLDNIKGYFTVKDHVEQFRNAGKVDKKEHVIIDQQNEWMKDQSWIEPIFRKAIRNAAGYNTGDLDIINNRNSEKLSYLLKNKKKYVHCQSGACTSVSSVMPEYYGYSATIVESQFSKRKKAGHKILTPNPR